MKQIQALVLTGRCMTPACIVHTGMGSGGLGRAKSRMRLLRNARLDGQNSYVLYKAQHDFQIPYSLLKMTQCQSTQCQLIRGNLYCTARMANRRVTLIAVQKQWNTECKKITRKDMRDTRAILVPCVILPRDFRQYSDGTITSQLPYYCSILTISGQSNLAIATSNFRLLPLTVGNRDLHLIQCSLCHSLGVFSLKRTSIRLAVFA